jgi:metallo-beta-lactamase family protein
MKIKFLGACGTVTGSSYMLTSGSGKSILIDLGMFQGLPEIDKLNYEPFNYDCSELVGAILTHAHLDHCGRLPILLSHGFTGNIWMTPATRDLTELSLLDSAKIAKGDKNPILYDTQLAVNTISQFKTINYDTSLMLGDFTIFLRDAGHILGSASLEITDNQANSSFKKIVFSGDLGNTPEDLLQTTEFIDSSDLVVMESTYGDRLHPATDPKDTLISEIHHIENSGGTLLIPAFSLDRTQEILHLLLHLKQDRLIKPETPVFLDSPMAVKATDIYLKYPNLYNSHVQADLKTGNPFDFPGLAIINKRNESESIHKHAGPKVIIAGSGMMNGGRIIGHAKHYLPMNTTRLLIVGYQGEATLGREILEGAKTVTLDNSTIQIKASVNSIQSMSSHADQKQLIEWLRHIKGVKKVFITHGEEMPRMVLSQKINTELGISDIEKPLMNQEFNI